MNKAELIEKVSKRIHIPVNTTKIIVDSIFDSMKESLKEGQGIEVRGFGSFSVRHYGSYKGRNPKTGILVDVPPKRLPHFKVGKDLRELVNRIEGETGEGTL